MKVLHINCNYITSQLHQNMMNHLDKTEAENTVFVPVYDDTKAKGQLPENIVVKKCFWKYDRVFYQFKQRKIFGALKKTLDPRKFEMVHAYTVFTDGGIAYKLREKYNIPYVVTVRNTDVNFFFKYMLHLRGYGVDILMHAEKIFFLSSVYMQIVMQYIPPKLRKKFAEKSCIIPNGIDDFWFENTWHDEKATPEKEIRLCFAGRVDKNKNCNLTMEACDRLIAEGYDVKYTVVGNVVDQETYSRMQQKPYVQYVPPADKEKLVTIYRDNHIFVMPSFTETFGLVYAEAMSQGLPVIYTKNEGFYGQFPEGRVGFGVDSRNAEDIVCAVKKIIENYAGMSAGCVESIDKFRWDTIVEQYVQFYNLILSNKSTGA